MTYLKYAEVIYYVLRGLTLPTPPRWPLWRTT